MDSSTEKEQEEKIKCTYASCNQHFNTPKEMRRHKQNDPAHDYCKKCNVDCEDWEAFHEHKVDAMRPWLEGSALDHDGQAPRHITCEFCSMDFKSFGGRRLHVEQHHQAEQYIVCTGCRHTFGRAYDLAAHLEFGHCSHISRTEFIKSIQQKYVITQIMSEPGTFLENLQASKALSGWSEFPGQISGVASPAEIMEAGHDELHGGVPLLDLEDEERNGIWEHSSDEDAVSQPGPVWPRLPGSKTGLETTFANFTLEDASSEHATSFTKDVPHPGRVWLSDQFPPLHGDKIRVRKLCSSDIVSQTPPQHPWTANGCSLVPRTSSSLASPGEWDNHIDERQKANDRENDRRHNILRNRFWDPYDADYQPELFVHGTTNRYFCPFAECDMCEYDSQSDFEVHLQISHTRRQYRCPLCLKVFRSASALIGHSEQGGSRCRVRETAGYKKFIDEVSGGFIKVEPVSQQNLFNADTALVQQGHRVHGVTKNLYSAKLPEE